jgi:hypothetical protein
MPDSYLKRLERRRRKDELERLFRKHKEEKAREDLEKHWSEHLGEFQKEALRRVVGTLFNNSAWMREEHAWALRAIIQGDIALDGDDQEVLGAVQYFIWMFEALEPWFKQHEHKRRERGEKPMLELVK